MVTQTPIIRRIYYYKKGTPTSPPPCLFFKRAYNFVNVEYVFKNPRLDWSFTLISMELVNR